MIFVLIGFTVGILLSLRYKVLVLIPATIVATIIVACAGVARQDEALATALLIVTVLTVLQLGYFGALTTRLIRKADTRSTAPRMYPSRAR